MPENLFEKIRANPSWLPFLRKLGKAPEQLAKIKFSVSLPEARRAKIRNETSRYAH